MKREEVVGLGEEIETLFKVVPPLKKLSDGYGYLGVLLRNRAEDKLQCHICGKWVKFLGLHSFQHHGITADQYRVKFQLPLRFPLCSVAMSARRSTLSMEPKHLAMLLRNRLNGCYKKKLPRARRSRIMRYVTTNMAHKNKHGACDEQIQRRYLIVCDIVGHQASQRDLVKHDDALRGIIYRRFKSINKFRRAFKLTEVKRHAISSDDAMVALLRKFYSKNGRSPRPKDFRTSVDGSPTAQAIRNRFGSWHRALMLAGMNPEAKFPQSASVFAREG